MKIEFRKDLGIKKRIYASAKILFLERILFGAMRMKLE
ncbi:MAG: hypothetical protein ACJAT4_001743 [Granulosicoccus sp.]|jgi:hypothetical protein